MTGASSGRSACSSSHSWRREVARRYLRLAKLEYQREVIVHLTASAERR